MAVVSISRIQVRRGQKNTGAGLPQLASGEIGWAIDTQELYIGNGSVSEGAPAVGNTQILTEHTNLFEFADTYSYNVDSGVIQTGQTSTSPVRRTLQNRLDDIVSVKAFGCAGDGTDCTQELQRAIDQLYINNATKGSVNSRVVLYMEAGTYLINNTIYLPPFVSLVGAGIDKTIITQTANADIFQTVNDISTPGNYASDAVSTLLTQAREILVSGMTLTINSAANGIVLQSCRNSVFKDIKFVGTYALGDTANSSTLVGMQLNSLSTAVSCNDNTFDNLIFTGLNYAVISDYDITNNKFTNCSIDTTAYGIVFGETSPVGVAAGPSYNIIQHCKFDNIYFNAIYIQRGQYNQSLNNYFYTIGNEAGTSATATHSVIKFVDEYNNSQGDYFERANDLSVDQSFITQGAFTPLVEGPAFFNYDFTIKTTIGEYPSPVTVFRLPGVRTGAYTVDYWYNSSVFDATRSGTLEVVFDKNTDTVEYSDEYNYTGNSLYADSLKFQAYLSDDDSDLTTDTLVITALNANASNDIGTLQFKVLTKS